MLADSWRHFDGGGAGLARLRRDGHDDYLRAVLALLRGEDHDHRALLRSIVAANGGLVGPEVDVGDYVSRPGDRP